MSQHEVATEVAQLDQQAFSTTHVEIREKADGKERPWAAVAPDDLHTLWDGTPRVIELRSSRSDDVRLVMSTTGFIDEPTQCELRYSGPSGVEEQRRERRLRDPRDVHQAITDVFNAGLSDPDATYHVKIETPAEWRWAVLGSDAHVVPVLDLIRRGATLPPRVEELVRGTVAERRLAAEAAHAAVSLVKAGRASTLMALALQASAKLQTLFPRPESTPISAIAAAVVPVEYDVCGVPVVRTINVGQMIVAYALRRGLFSETNATGRAIELAPGLRRQCIDAIDLAGQDYAWSRRLLDPSANLGVQGALAAINFVASGTGYINLGIGGALYAVNRFLHGPLGERRNYQFHVARATNSFSDSAYFDAVLDRKSTY